jgi:hypothetical protein
MKPARTYWFAPKRFGIGYSPASWQGWALLAIYVALMIAMPQLLPEGGHFRIVIMIALTIGFLIIAFSKTRTSRS